MMKTDLTTLIFDDLMKEPKYVLKLFNTLIPERRKRLSQKIEIKPPIELLKDSNYSLLRLEVDEIPIFIIQANLTFNESELKEIAYCFLTGLQVYMEEENLNYEDWIEDIYLESEFFILCTNVKTETTEISLKKDIYRNPNSEIDLSFNLISKSHENDFLGNFFKLCRKINSLDIYQYKTRADIREFIDECINDGLFIDYFNQDIERKVEMIFDNIRVKQIEIDMKNQLDILIQKEIKHNRIMDQIDVLYGLGLSPIEVLDRVTEINPTMSSSDICEWYSDYYRNK